MHRHRAPFSALDTFFAVRSWVDCTTSMSGFDLRQADRQFDDFDSQEWQPIDMSALVHSWVSLIRCPAIVRSHTGCLDSSDRQDSWISDDRFDGRAQPRC